MSEFVADIEDWGLQAIVRGSSGEFTKILETHNMDDDKSLTFCYQKTDLEYFDLSYGFSDELKELYKPFYPADQPSHSSEDNNIVHDDKQIFDQSSSLGVAKTNPAAYAPKYKKRKHQHKRVMVKVSAEGLTSDMWAWRKYGQKPIKGSPFPRSYYRCSSSKSCLARKQVEESCTDPGMFIITYTAEHSHSQPTRRNSLAGTVRQKFPAIIKHEKPNEWVNNSSSLTHQVVDVLPPIIKEECVDVDDTNDFSLSEFELDGDFFSGLHDFDEFVLEPAGCQTSVPQVSVRSCS